MGRSQETLKEEREIRKERKPKSIIDRR